MIIFFYSVFFVLGLIIGSFLNCVIYRLENEQSFLKGRSFCPHCKKELAWFDLVPILSFIFLKGKCRYCQQKISWQYPLVEFLTGILFFVFSFYFLPYGWLQLFFLLIIVSFLVVIFMIDLRHLLILDSVIYPLILITLIYSLIFNLYFDSLNSFLLSLASGFFAALPFLLIVLVSRGKWMGAGDIKLAFFIGLFLGYPAILVALFLAFFIGAIIGLGLIIIGKKELGSEVPFAPFLIFGTLTAFLFSSWILSAYLKLFY